MSEWINCAEQMPTEEDANNYKQVYLHNGIEDPVQLCFWDKVLESDTWYWCKAPDRPLPPK